MPINTIAGQGTVITHYDAWRVNSSFGGSVNPITNFERVDTDNFNNLGSGMSYSSGYFTFPVTGIWQITAIGSFYASGGYRSRYNGIEMEVTTNNSSYDNAARFYANIGTNYGTGYTNGICQHLMDITNTSTHKVRFKTEVEVSQSTFDGANNHSQNLFTFIRFGDT